MACGRAAIATSNVSVNENIDVRDNMCLNRAHKINQSRERIFFWARLDSVLFEAKGRTNDYFPIQVFESSEKENEAMNRSKLMLPHMSVEN